MADKPVKEEKLNQDIDASSIIREGGVLSRIFIEVQANDLEAAKKSLESAVFSKLKQEKESKILEIKIFDILKDDAEDFFSGVSEIKLVSNDFRTFINMIIRYGPSAIEIIEPEEIVLKSDEMHSLVADISEFTQMFSTQIMAMMKDPERRQLYQKIVSQEQPE